MFQPGELVREMGLISYGIPVKIRFMDGSYRGAEPEAVAAKIRHMKEAHAEVITAHWPRDAPESA